MSKPEERKDTTEHAESRTETESQPKLIIPSFLRPDMFRKEEKRERKEKRLRVRRSKFVDEGKAKINPELAQELEIRDKVEIVVVGGGSRERKYIFDVVLDVNVPKNEVWCNEIEMKRLGIADNTMATIRAYRLS